MKTTLIVILTLLAGCSSPGVMKLDEEWRPLERIVEGPDKLLKPGQTTCLGTTLFVRDLADWVKLNPEGSVERKALLLHEQQHARRQIEYGLVPWLARYVGSPEFRWNEERIGWESEVVTLVRGGRQVDVEQFARILADEYVHFGGRMISREDARLWLVSVIETARKQ